MLFFTEHEHEAANCEFFLSIKGSESAMQYETFSHLFSMKHGKHFGTRASINSRKGKNWKNSLITVGECFHAFWNAFEHQTVNLLWRKHRSCWMIAQVFAHFFLSKCSRTSSGMFVSTDTNNPSFSRVSCKSNAALHRSFNNSFSSIFALLEKRTDFAGAETKHDATTRSTAFDLR